jgi:hypothetical protein
MSTGFKETETTLVIQSESPRLIANDIAALPSIGGYKLLSRGSLAMKDVYLDSIDELLESRQAGLRIRKIGHEILIAFKGPPEYREQDVVERLEIEAPWSHDVLDRILGELVELGIGMPDRATFPAKIDEGADPVSVMKRMGFEVAQKRTTDRTIRNVVESEPETVMAELAIDAVVYHLCGFDINHFEVELEVKGEGGIESVNSVVGILEGMYGRHLRKWKYSKLVTGRAMEKLLKYRAMKRYFEENGDLKPAAYDRIKEFIDTGKQRG